MKLRLAILLSLSLSPSWAGYRVHKLKVYHYNERGKVEATETVLSTLDNFQYEHHHGGYRSMRVVLEDTWYCPGDTSRKKPCDKLKRAPNRGPASTDPKRRSLAYDRSPIRP